VIRSATRERPADAVLRLALRQSRELSAHDAPLVSRAVFSYYRWKRFVGAAGPLEAQIRAALERADRFARDPDSFSTEELRRNAVPDWIGTELDLSGEWLRSLQAEPHLWLRARAGRGADVAAALGHCRPFGPGRLADTLEYFGSEDLFRTELFHKGAFELQDISSQAVGFVCGPVPGQTWWDACAGEGGKLLHLSDLMGNRGLIWASDRAGWRLKNLKRRAARAGVYNYRSIPWDGGPRLPTRTRFDGVLVDAPCSGVGTWQRNPHARWTVTPGDVLELSGLQIALLTNAAGSLKPGGKLIYAVCTLTRSETTGVADAFEKRFPDYRPIEISNPFGRVEAPSTRLWIWPQELGGNGMFVAGWERPKASGGSKP
jgi:16S rRNA (cytosine967-C5)-methyltransferase